MLATRVTGLGWRGAVRSTQSYATKAEPAKTVNKSGPTPEMLHSKRIRRSTGRKSKLESQKVLTTRMAKYLSLKHRPTKLTQSKTLKTLFAAYGSMPSPFDVDESALTNEEFVEHGLHREIAVAAKYWGISPGFVKSFKPSVNLTVKHGEKTTVYRGHALESISVREKPAVKYQAKEDSHYTLLMVDPDIALKDSPHDAWNHYMVVNVPGNQIEKGQVIADWIPPAPPKSTGVHRYIWLLLEQPSQLQFSEQALSSKDFNRTYNFDQFITKYKLKPRGMVFHRTEFDKDVEQLYQGWGGSASGFSKTDYQRKLQIKQRQYQSM